MLLMRWAGRRSQPLTIDYASLSRPTVSLRTDWPGREGADVTAAALASSVPATTSIGRVLVTLTVALLLGLLFSARGIVHAGQGMADGPERTVTLRIGHLVLDLATTLHLTVPWDLAQTALGRRQQPSIPPLLASAPPSPVPPHRAQGGLPVVVRLGIRGRPAPAVAAPRRATPRLAALRWPTRNRPLRLLITGDSLPGYLGPQVLDALVPSGRVRGWTEVHDGTGLTRPDFVDWSVVARQQVAGYAPDATVVMMGGNDFQNMVLLNGRVLVAGTPAWTQEYARRAALCMRIWTQGQPTRRVYWLSLPPARDPAWAFDFSQIDRALREAVKRVPGAEYLGVLGPVTDHGRYADYVNVNGQPTLIREPDGVHLNFEGSQLVANLVIPHIRHEWHLP